MAPPVVTRARDHAARGSSGCCSFLVLATVLSLAAAGFVVWIYAKVGELVRFGEDEVAVQEVAPGGDRQLPDRRLGLPTAERVARRPHLRRRCRRGRRQPQRRSCSRDQSGRDRGADRVVPARTCGCARHRAHRPHQLGLRPGPAGPDRHDRAELRRHDQPLHRGRLQRLPGGWSRRSAGCPSTSTPYCDERSNLVRAIGPGASLSAGETALAFARSPTPRAAGRGRRLAHRPPPRRPRRIRSSSSSARPSSG